MKKKNYIVKFDKLEKLCFDKLLSTICMISPFSIEEKQKLLETKSVEEKMKILDEIISFQLVSNIENTTIQ